MLTTDRYSQRTDTDGQRHRCLRLTDRQMLTTDRQMLTVDRKLLTVDTQTGVGV